MTQKILLILWTKLWKKYLKEGPSFCALKFMTIPMAVSTMIEHGRDCKEGCSWDRTPLAPELSKSPADHSWDSKAFWGTSPSLHTLLYWSQTTLLPGVFTQPFSSCPVFSHTRISPHKILEHLTPTWHLLLRGPRVTHTYNRSFQMFFEAVSC